jgi:hypothetical protein
MLLAAIPGLAQLDQNCTISVLNRNIQVAPNGTWVLSNVPANQGRVRARATCIQSGITRFGQSDLFTVPLNGTINLQPIIFGPISPIPSLLTLTATPTSITTVGATSQIKAIATYPDNHTADVSASATGTTYTTSNSAVATVSADGVVRAVSNGVVIITAFNEGTSGSTQVTIGIPPQITITSPLPGATVTQGGIVPITAQVVGGATVLAVSFSINGRIEFTTTTAPYIFNFSVPTGVSSFTLGASVRDVAGATATAPVVVVMAVPDPLTTVTGNVVDPSNVPVAGASVNCLGITGTSAVGGSFSIPGVPTARGSIVCFASFIVGGLALTGSSAAVAPVLGGATNVGPIKLSSLSSRGTDFWLAFQDYYLGNGAQLFIMTETSANYTVSGTGFNVTGAVTASTPATIAIPNSFQITSNQAIETKGIHLTSDAEITATFFYPQAATNDTYLAIPTALLGTEYLAVAFQGNIVSPGSEFVVLGTQANTNVTIVPTCLSQSGTAAGSTVTVTLNQGQTYQYLCSGSGDVTGSQITSDKPISVIAGDGCVDVPTGSSACDILSEMMFPVATLYGSDFYTAPFPGNGFDLIRVVAARDNTTITADDGVSPVTFVLNRGAFREIQTKRPSHYTSDKPITVVQFSVGISIAGIGDPSSMQILPTNAFRNSARFYSPSGFSQGNFAVIVAPTAAVSTVALNGVPVTGFKPLPGGSYQYAVTPVVTAQSVVTSSQPVGVYAIGFTSAGSYAHPTTF